MVECVLRVIDKFPKCTVYKCVYVIVKSSL